MCKSAPQSKNAVSTNIKLSIDKCIWCQIFRQSTSVLKGCMYIMFDIIDTHLRHGRGLIVCSSLQEFSKTKESTLYVIWNVDTAFLLCGAEIILH